MRENFFKSYYKAFGIFSTILVAVAVILTSYLTTTNFLSANVSSMIAYTVLGVVVLSAVLGLSGLLNENISFFDLLRTIVFVAGIGAGIIYAVNGRELWQTITFLASGNVAFIELLIRIFKVHQYDENVSIKNYFGSLAGKYNALFIALIGAAIGIGVFVLANYNLSSMAFFNDMAKVLTNVYFAIAILFSIVVILLLSSAGKGTEANLIDLVFAIGFIAALFAFGSFAVAGVLVKNAKIVTFIGVLAAGFGLVLVLRALTYTGGAPYANPSHKMRTYFRNTYTKYDVVFPILAAIVVMALVSTTVALKSGNSTYPLVKILNIMKLDLVDYADILAYVGIGIMGLLFIFTIIYNKFRNQNVVRTDKILVGLFLSSLFVVASRAIAIVHDTKIFSDLINIILLASGGVFLLYSFIVLIIRLKHFDPVAAMITATTQQQAQQQAEAKAKELEEEAQIEEPEEVEEESNDPFALTAEDEEIYNSIYGQPEEEQQEEVTEEPQEEVVYEEVPAEEGEEVVYEEVPAEEGEEVIYEEVPAEEGEEVVYEEVPAEEATPVDEAQEDADSDDAEDADEEDEEDDDDAEEADEEGEEEVVEEKPAAKEKGIVVQEFQVIDGETGEPKKIKRKFVSKMMFAPYETKEYYNEIKNYLEMYRAKGRQSARCETFRYKGLVAKVALGGKAIKVALAIDPSFIEENPKYHLKDVSAKKQYKDVPVMIKVRSDRGLKYFKELVDYMMANRLVKPKRNFEPTNYMPQLIPNGEAILGSLGMSTYYLQDTMNARGIPDELPDNLDEYIPMIQGDELGEEEDEAAVYLDTLCNHFNDHDVVTIDVLKSMHIVNKGNVIRIKARGTLDRKLIIYAEYFDADALKMLMCTNSTAIKIVR